MSKSSSRRSSRSTQRRRGSESAGPADKTVPTDTPDVVDELADDAASGNATSSEDEKPATGKGATEKTAGKTTSLLKDKSDKTASDKATSDAAVGDDDASDQPAKTTRRERRAAKKAVQLGNPRWFVPVMLGLFIVGLIWIVTFYLTQMAYPIPDITYWNLGIGFGLLMAGFAMTTRWK